MGIGETSAPGEVYEETLQAGLRFAFHELNLHRLTTILPGWDEKMANLFEQNGLSLEVRQVNNCYQNHRRFDLLHYGILRREWEALVPGRQQ